MTYSTDFKVLNPDAIEMELAVRMTLREWKLLQGQLPSSHPAYSLTASISKMVDQATTEFIAPAGEIETGG